ncbi:peptidase S8, partial [Streptomyces sp. NPDC048419]
MRSHRRKTLIRRGAPALLSAAALVTGALAVASQSDAFATATATASPTVSTHRLCSTPSKPGYMACEAVVRTDLKAQKTFGRHGTPKGFGPADLQAAYHLSKDGGKGATVAIVDANDDPNAEKDLAAYRSQYGLPECSTGNG